MVSGSVVDYSQSDIHIALLLRDVPSNSVFQVSQDRFWSFQASFLDHQLDLLPCMDNPCYSDAELAIASTT